MSLNTDEYYQEWVAIESLTITNFNGKTEDLLPYFLQIDIQEDIMMPVCSGILMLMDTNNFYEEFPITGEESITIKYKDFYSNSIIRNFTVYGVGAREAGTETTSIFTLNFCSEELLNNRIQKYSKSYKDKLPHEIVSDAAGKVGMSKPFNIQPTIELQDYVVPNLYPFEIIQQMCNRAISAEGYTGSYVFYEDMLQFNFVSLEKIIQKPPIKYNIGSGNLAGIKNPKYIFKNYKFRKAIDNVSNMMTGGQGVETKKLDLLNRKIEDTSYNHFSGQYSEIQRINTTNPELKTQTSKYKYQSNKGLYKVVIKSEEDNAKSSKDKAISKRYNIMSTFANGPKIIGELPFNAELTVGDMVDVMIPKKELQDSSVPEMEKYVKGKYLVTALRQIIRADHAETVVELSKESYPESHG